MEFGILGPLHVRTGDGRQHRFAPRERRVLAALLVHANRTMDLPYLVGIAWDEDPPPTAKRQIQNSLSALRRQLSPAVRADGSGYQISVDSGQLDSLVFQELVAQAAAAQERGQTIEAVSRLRAALGQWRGPALADCAGRGLEAAAARLDEQRLAAVELCLDLELRSGRHAEVVAELTELVVAHPLRERLVGLLMLALHRSDRQADALAAYQRLRTRLADDLGLDPGVALRDLQAAILRDEVDQPVRPAVVPGAPTPRQLPAANRHFVGRTPELAELSRLADEAAGSRGAVVVAAIVGTGGIGKTSLALHWSHQAAARFPDGQLYVNLRGFDPSGPPVAPTEAVRGFLDALAVPPDRIPPTLDAQAALFRSLVAGRRLLLVLDNARDAGQVQPLLPGSPSCFVLVTSRNDLPSLVAAGGARLLTLTPLSTVDSHELLARHIGRSRLADDPIAADQLVAHSARLPLALAIVAARAVAQPDFPLGAFAAELTTSGQGLDAFDAGDPGTRVRAVFSWSYRLLSEPAAALFRLLGLHPGPDLATAAAASLSGVRVEAARQALAELAHAHLVTEYQPGRFTLHDLLRMYARELAGSVDPEDDRARAIRRVLDHYLHGSHAAAVALNPGRAPIPLAPVADGVTAGDVPDDWFAREYPVLLGAVQLAAATGFDTHTEGLAWSLAEYVDRRGRWRDLQAIQRAALDAAVRQGDARGQAYAHRGLARACAQRGRYDEAREHYRQALDRYVEVGDAGGQATTHLTLGLVLERQGGYADALAHCEQARDLFAVAGSEIGRANALNSIGWCHAQLGGFRTALGHCREALAVLEELGVLDGQAGTWDTIGYVHCQLGEYAEAVTCFQTSLDLSRQVGDRHGEASALNHLGDAYAAAGDRPAAAEVWRSSLRILDEVGHPDAADVRSKLDGGARVGAPPS